MRFEGLRLAQLSILLTTDSISKFGSRMFFFIPLDKGVRKSRREKTKGKTSAFYS